MAGVILKDLNKTFKGVIAVNDVSLEINDKEFLVLVGPSGCGKTTALRMVAGLEEATSGEIYIGDRLVNDVSAKDRDIAMVFQNYALYPHMSVYDNMAFGLKLRKVPKLEIRRRVEEAAKLLGLETLLDRKPKQLSGGQRQRVALGRAIVREPKVFLMDEPLSNLDAKLRVQTRAELIKLHRRLGITTIYVTHDQVEAMTMGDRIVVMKDGIVQQVDSPMGLYNTPANVFVAGFIGTPSMNFVNATLKKENGRIIVDACSFKVMIPQDKCKPCFDAYVDKPVVFGIRPEDIADKAISSMVTPTEENTIKVMVDVIEPMGSVVTVYLTSDTNAMIATIDSDTKAVENQEMEIVFDMNKAHLFDKETEVTIG
ncbi:sn-glycerol-3-phosphate ABC transporter ATP-binding protein UgpC [uncultured Desulfobulbus sp.]|uniref:ABC transporter ATP-binding protein n=1 Tax=uncultured Desulfobulbus sp. TaxID=239745 RepID=UPI0029C73289|nr:sn-glycerol-3-phosphate ABC transporter ATP-binding protein UgpC [uncultured Desulfobulbus sp.]